MYLSLYLVETIESYLQISSGNPVEELSAQHINSCAPNPLKCGGIGGCEGSITQLGLVYTQLFGLTNEADYPYTSGNVSEEVCIHCLTYKKCQCFYSLEALVLVIMMLIP